MIDASLHTRKAVVVLTRSDESGFQPNSSERVFEKLETVAVATPGPHLGLRHCMDLHKCAPISIPRRKWICGGTLRQMKKSQPKRDVPLSLHPLTPEEALKRAMHAPPSKPAKKKPGKK